MLSERPTGKQLHHVWATPLHTDVPMFGGVSRTTSHKQKQIQLLNTLWRDEAVNPEMLQVQDSRIAKVLVILSQLQTTADVHRAMVIVLEDWICTATRCFFAAAGAVSSVPSSRKLLQVKPTTGGLSSIAKHWPHANQRSFIRTGKTLLQCGNSGKAG